MANYQFFLAYVDPGVAFDPVAHARKDEEIISFSKEQVEGEFATLSLEARNTIKTLGGFLGLGRKQWAWFSVSVNGGEPLPRFYGRLVAIPSSITKEVITLDFLARPIDFAVQKRDLAATMRQLPFWDPVFVADDKLLDDDVVLEARTQVWHIDPVTHIVTASDLLSGEDGTLDFQESEVPYDSVDVSLDQPPIRAVRVTADIPYHQTGSGTLPAFKDMEVQTLAGRGLIDGWPKAGANLGGGWSVAEKAGTFLNLSADVVTQALSPLTSLVDADIQSIAVQNAQSHGVIPFPDVFDRVIMTAFSWGVSHSDTDDSGEISQTFTGVLKWDVFCSLALQYEADRERRDVITFELVADSQPIVTMPDDEEVLELKISGRDVSGRLDPLDLYSEVPIGPGTHRSYVKHARGHSSIEYLIMLARAHVAFRSRAVKIKYECNFERAMGLSLRKNATVHDHRLPGGVASGKIIAYAERSNGGRISGEVTIACSIGFGGTVEEVAGDPTYIVDDYIDPDMYEHEGAVHVLPSSDIGYTVINVEPNDDGIEFPLSSVPYTVPPHIVKNFAIEFTPAIPQIQNSTKLDDCDQLVSASYAMTLDTGPISQWLSGASATIDFSLKPLDGGPFETFYPIIVTPLRLPKQIDLGAAP